MKGYYFKKILSAIFVLFIIITLNFFLPRMIFQDPAQPYYAGVPEDAYALREQIREENGFNKPLILQYTGSVVVQLTTALPTSMDMNGIKVLKAQSGEMQLTSLLMKKDFYDLFLVRETLYGGKESLSIAIVGEDEKIALSVYMRRSDANTIEAKAKDLFEKLWTKYYKL